MQSSSIFPKYFILSDDSGRRKGIYPAIHLQAKSSTPTESKIIGTTIFTNWEPARWVRRLRMMDAITLKSGKLSVASSGIYYVYAQVRSRLFKTV